MKDIFKTRMDAKIQLEELKRKKQTKKTALKKSLLNMQIAICDMHIRRKEKELNII